MPDYYWLTATTDTVLDNLIALWHEAEDLDAEADAMRAEAMNLQHLASEVTAKTEEIIKSLIESHPEWADDLKHQRDPREESEPDLDD